MTLILLSRFLIKSHSFLRAKAKSPCFKILRLTDLQPVQYRHTVCTIHYSKVLHMAYSIAGPCFTVWNVVHTVLWCHTMLYWGLVDGNYQMEIYIHLLDL
jgi:hypothetical protein